MKTQVSSGQNGFMLLEIVAGIAIIGLIVLVINNVPPTLRLMSRSNHQTLAQQIATKAIENLRSQTYSGLSDTGSPLPINDTRINQLPNGAATYQIQDCPNASSPHPVCTSASPEQTKYVIALVTWVDQGKQQSVELDTLISLGGIQ